MAYKALYRTYRPKLFSDVIGQEHVVRTLLNSIMQDKVGHAYLFSGPRGTGKTTIARLLARTINCESPVDGEPCGKCGRCSGPEEGLGVLEIDAASHGSVDDMRMLVSQVSQVPLAGGKMVYIIDEVHMLSKEAFNAFLKTLEEPPEHAIFVLATTEPGKLLPTIHSRCQHFSFRRLPLDVLAGHVKKICVNENIQADSAAMKLIARAGDGSVRDSISVLEQAIAYEPDGLTLDGVRDVLGMPDRMDVRKLAGFIVSRDPGGLSKSYAALIALGREPGEILSALISHFRDLLLKALSIEHADLEMLPDVEMEELSSQAESASAADIHSSIAFLAKCEVDIKWEDEAELILEVSLLRLTTKFGRKREGAESRPMPAETPAQDDKPESQPVETSHHPGIDKKETPAEKPKREKSLSGGVSLKRKKEEPQDFPDVPKQKEKPAKEKDKPEKVERKQEKKAQPAFSDIDLLGIPDDVDPLWKDTLESVREISIAEYILLARAKPSPPPSEWPKIDTEKRMPLAVTLVYRYEDGMLLRQIKSPPVLNRLISHLEEVLERPLNIKVGRSRPVGGVGGGVKKTQSPQDGMHNGDGAVPGASDDGGQSLFPGAGREVPADPDRRRIHNLIVQEFPDYKFDKN